MELLVSAMAARAAIFAAAVRTGRPAQDLAKLVRVPQSVLGDADARLSHDRTCAVWTALARETNDPALGLFAAQLIDTAANDRLQPLLANAATLGDATRTFIRYQQLYHTGNASRSEVATDRWIITFALHRTATPCPFLSDFVLANWARRLRYAAGAELAFVDVRLRRAAPTELALYRTTFGPHVHFAASEDSLQLASSAAAIPIRGANPTLRGILEQQASLAIESLDTDRAFLHDARAALEIALLDGVIDVDGLARSMATSPRTLQRRLASCETTFQALLDDVRRDLALGHLSRGRSVTDTAFLLGFSELSAFSRAFRRWTGRAPRNFVRA